MSNAAVIAALYVKAREAAEDEAEPVVMTSSQLAVLMRAAAGLLECHDATGIDLHQWLPVREFVESMTQTPVLATDSLDERLPKPSPLDHHKHDGFDNQEWYWHCYTCDIFRQEWV